MADTIGEINPFRYCGYYYDSEVGLYYLTSRYYDPVIGRFVNADGLVVAGSGMLSGNMYLYCQNNPICCIDPTGALGSFFDFPLSMADRMQMSQSMLDNYYAAKAVAERIENTPVLKIASDVWEDLGNFDRNNTSEIKALESNYFSSYKGVPVIRIGGNRSGSFGAIFLTRYKSEEEDPKDVVRHEYGHTRQLKQLGILNYALCIGIPSWQNWGSGEYYNKPWEITADIYGGVSRHHTQKDIMAGFAYLEASKDKGVRVWSTIE